MKKAQLIPFKNGLSSPNLELKVEALREGDFLSLNYACEGEIDKLIIPDLKSNPSRLDELWKASCFEAFLSVDNKNHYWEFNFSPSRDWNAYYFDFYRKGQIQEKCIQQINIEIKRTPTGLYSKILLDLSSILSAQTEAELNVGLSTVLQHQDKSYSYWALSHLGETPDFHTRDSFILKM